MSADKAYRLLIQEPSKHRVPGAIAQPKLSLAEHAGLNQNRMCAARFIPVPIVTTFFKKICSYWTVPAAIHAAIYLATRNNS